MRATALLITIFLLAQSAAAVIYQCRDAQGNLVITDDRDSLPADCRDLQERPEKEDLPSAPVSATPTPVRPEEQSPTRKSDGAPPRAERPDEEKSPQAPARSGR